VYLWMLEQNTSAQGFYHALGGVRVEKAEVPARVPLRGSPNALRIRWPDATALAARGGTLGP
jgi:hypothetical protein